MRHKYFVMIMREKIIKHYIAGKDVLDVGSVGKTDDFFLWRTVKKHAARVTGIDIEKSDDLAVVKGNMENYKFNHKFDVIVARDVIEHVDNQGLFLDNIHKHLKDDGVLILTTPNAKWPTVIFKPLGTHTLWHDRFTLSGILKRHGFLIKHMQYYYGNRPYYGLFKRLVCLRQGLLVVCGKKS